MKFIHTSDWHLGKLLEGNSRIEEQILFGAEFEELVNTHQPQVVMISGDIYDTYNPPAAAEALFYKIISRITKDKNRVVIIIAGNHDNPERLTASMPLAYEHGIIFVGTPKSIVENGDYGFYSIEDSKEGFFRLKLQGETVSVIAMPYPSEKRINEVLGTNLDEGQMQKEYSKKIGGIFSNLEKEYSEESINIAMGHFYIAGGAESGSERSIQLGGALSVNVEDMPKTPQYIAMGHLHRPQTVPGMEKKCHYSGSILQYSKDEGNFSKSINLVNIEPKKDMELEKIYLKNHKPIEIWKTNSVEEAIKMCHDHKDENSWVFLSIKTDRVIEASEIKEMKTVKDGIIEICPVFVSQENVEEFTPEEDKDMGQIFNEFFQMKKGIGASDDVINMFLEILEQEDSDETN